MADLKELRIADDLIVSGNLKVTGEQIVTSTSDTTIKDNTITLNKGASSLPAAGSGVEIESNGSIVGSLVYKSSGWDFGGANLTQGTFILFISLCGFIQFAIIGFIKARRPVVE